jgi:hypothetical protein
MKMFIANCTKQVVSFIYRLPEVSASRQQQIEIGGQIQISGDLTKIEVDAIIEQHTKYGLVAADELDRSKPFIGLCYSIDKPVRVGKVEQAIEHNDKVLEQRGAQTRKESALAVASQVEQNSPGGLTALEMTVEQEKPGSEGDVVGAQTVRVDRNAPAQELTGDAAQRQRNSRRKKD